MGSESIAHEAKGLRQTEDVNFYHVTKFPHIFRLLFSASTQR